MALAHGYAIQVVSCEAVILADGEQASNVHNVPADIISRQQANWEPHQHQSTIREASNG